MELVQLILMSLAMLAVWLVIDLAIFRRNVERACKDRDFWMQEALFLRKYVRTPEE